MAKTALRLVSNEHGSPFEAQNARPLVDLCDIGHDFHYWRGASGAHYLHSVYPLFECPELPKANYIIVRRLDSGDRVPLSIGQTNADAGSLNLAHIRHDAARLGGNEIHVHVMTQTAVERRAAETDLLLGQFRFLEAALRAEAANSPA